MVMLMLLRQAWCGDVDVAMSGLGVPSDCQCVVMLMLLRQAWCGDVDVATSGLVW